MKLCEKFLKIKQDASGYTENPIIRKMEIDFFEKLELESHREMTKNGFLVESVKKFNKYFESVDIEFKRTKNIWKNIFTLYNEINAFFLLNSRVFTEKIKENSNHKTPDFKIKFRGEDIFIELKSFLWVDCDYKYNNYFEEAFDQKINTEEALKKKSIDTTFQVAQPFKKRSDKYSPLSRKIPIEKIIDKFNQNYKPDQFKNPNTVLMISLDQFIIPNSRNPLQKEYKDNRGKESGILWNVAFGKKDDKIKSIEKNIKQDFLEKEGILKSYNHVRGILFFSFSLKPDNRIVGLYRKNDILMNYFFRYLTYDNCNTDYI